jgi:hypothetical protein
MRGRCGTPPPHPRIEEEPSRSKGATIIYILLNGFDEDPSHISIRTKPCDTDWKAPIGHPLKMKRR